MAVIKVVICEKFQTLFFSSQGELATLESQGRISKLSSDELQAKLMQAFAENEELARKLKEAEDALRDKVSN